ncbi:MAG: EAL domain-containing protein [Woeseiaceae bacterium]|nr:EAL domain-containing protein [Woeseiaceae bacterium]
MKGLAFLPMLKQGVGRKIFTLFLIAGVLPVAFTAWLAHHEFSRAAEERVFESLHRTSKSQGLDILSRLMRVEQQALQLADMISNAGGRVADARHFLLDDFLSVASLSATGEAKLLHGLRSSEFLSHLSELEPPGSGRTRLLTDGSGSDVRMAMIVPIDRVDGETALIFRVRPEAIWPDRAAVPHNTTVCVYPATRSESFHCTDSTGTSTLAIPSTATEASLEVRDIEGSSFVSLQWELFLESRFDSPSWMVGSTQPASYAFESSADFQRVFLPALSAVLVLIALLSFRAIGQSLDPLKRLGDAARALSKGDRESRVNLRTGDEFESLGQTFNVMADRLSSQITMLEAMSEIDKLILNGSDIDAVCEAVCNSLRAITASPCVVTVAASRKGRAAEAYLVTLVEEQAHRSRVTIPDSSPTETVGDCRTHALTETPDWLDTSGFESAGLSHVAMTPVRVGDRNIGYLAVGGIGDGFFLESHQAQLSDLAEHFAVALDALERDRELYRRANFDALTGLPNRQLLQERLAEYLAAREEDSDSGALLYIDLDRFKEINDVFGHSIGDVVLRLVADRIESELGNDGFVARIGGDEFVVVLTDAGSHEQIESMAKTLIARLTDAYSVFGVDHFISASIGVVVIPDDGGGVELLMKNADAAMYRAKEAGRSTFEFFNAELNADGRRRIELERDLRFAISKGQLSLVYQPQYSIQDDSLSGCEALMRWSHPEHGLVSPEEFVQLAEESGLIVELGKWLIERACSNFRDLLDRGVSLNEMSINVSARQLRDQEFVAHVTDTLESFDLDPSLITLEVTETVVAHNKDVVVSLLESLRRTGIRVAIDDFGTGYSSLSYLQNLPFDIIKIDRSFVEKIESDDSSANICTTIIKMAHELGKIVVAEGVETPQQFEFLKKHDCEIVQGYIYSRPLSVDHLQLMIEKLEHHTQRRRALKVL